MASRFPPETVEISASELERLRINADRYEWLRRHAVKIQGSEVWYQGGALDIRVDVGRDRVADQHTIEHKPNKRRS